MGIIETAKELISGIKILSSSYSKDHIALLETKGRILYELVEETAAENEKLKAEVAELKEKLSHYVISESFTEHNGAAFKKNIDGSYNKTPFCPKCHGSLSVVGMQIPYTCSNKSCGHRAGFTKTGLTRVIAELP